LTLHLAQVRLRAGDSAAAWKLMDAVVALASPTGQWPEAIHPLTFGGCMGDGQHIWAAAEWLMLVRNLFVREEGDGLVIGTGVKLSWLDGAGAEFGPTLTPHGTLSVGFDRAAAGVNVTLSANWRATSPALELRVPGCGALSVPAGDGRTQFLLPYHPDLPPPAGFSS
jgi:hypothetical protein